MNRIRPRTILGLAVCALAFASITAQAAGVDISGFLVAHGDIVASLGMLAMAGEIDLKAINTQLDKIETNMKTMSEKADGELKTLGEVSKDTKTALDNLGTLQRELADRLTQIEQKGVAMKDQAPVETWGSQVTKAESYKAFVAGTSQKMRVEVKNTLVGTDATVAPDRRPGVVAGAAQLLTIETLLSSLPTTSNAVEYTRENLFTNNAAEVAEGGVKPESVITFELVNAPVSTVAHWIKISRQLASDNVQLAAYVNNRMRYGVDRRVETQLVVGNGAAPNISGMMKAGNFTPHGYLSGALGATLPKLVLIRRAIAASWNAGYPAEAILLNPMDWADIEIELLTTPASQARVSVDAAGNMRLFGIPVVQSVGMPVDSFLVGRFSEAYTVYNREGITVELSESDADNFTKNLITIRAERRLVLATEVPGAVRGGDLTPPAA